MTELERVLAEQRDCAEYLRLNPNGNERQLAKLGLWGYVGEEAQLRSGLPKPYYEEPGIAIYHADCREILPFVSAESLITDPVWPNCEHIFPGVDAPRLLRSALSVAKVRRAVIQLGCNSDPRFLSNVPYSLPFLRVCYLEYAVVGYLGRIMRDAEVAYVFGDAPDSKPGAQVMPGRVISTRSNGDKGWSNKARTAEVVASAVARMQHPTKRLLQHVRWLCKWFSGKSAVDPFCGSGTTLLACKSLGVPVIGIEIEERYCAITVERLRQSVLDLQPVASQVPEQLSMD